MNSTLLEGNEPARRSHLRSQERRLESLLSRWTLPGVQKGFASTTVMS